MSRRGSGKFQDLLRSMGVETEKATLHHDFKALASTVVLRGRLRLGSRHLKLYCLDWNPKFANSVIVGPVS